MSIVHQCIVNYCRMIWKENSLPTEHPRHQSSLRFENILLLLSRFETMTLTTTVTVWMMRYWKHLFTQSLSITNNKCLGFFSILFDLFVRLHLPSVCNCPIDLSILLLNLFGTLCSVLSQFVRFCFEEKIIFGSHVIVSIIRHNWISKGNFEKIREDKKESSTSHIHIRVNACAHNSVYSVTLIWFIIANYGTTYV